MAQSTERFKAFVKLGEFIRTCLAGGELHENRTSGADWEDALWQAIRQAGEQNAWFTRESILQALTAWGDQLREENLNRWLSDYDLEKNTPKTVALIMAGNIPLVGFHDFLTVLICGNRVLVKTSSNDGVLLPFLAGYLAHIQPSLGNAIVFAEGTLEAFDAVIATGSNNTARYFEYYFGKKPHIIRRNRNAVAVLTGLETPEQLRALGSDIFTYFGLGCRNVSKLFVPEAYDFTAFFKAITPYESLLNHRKYANNYDYNKAVYLMSRFPILDNGFLILKEDPAYSSPIGVLFYEHYKTLSEVQARIIQEGENIQCVVGRGVISAELPFGSSQKPALWDYADAVDTVEFLLRT